MRPFGLPAISLCLLAAAFATGCGSKGADGAAGGSGATGAAGQPLNDSQSAGVILTANTGAAIEAPLGSTRGQNSDVQSFASQLASDATQLGEQESALLAQLNLTVAPCSSSDAVQNDNIQALAMLQTQTDVDFDLAFVNARIAADSKLLQLLDTSLVTGAESADFKAFLLIARAQVDAHLQTAQSLQTTLASDGGGGAM